jgi:predicted RNA-binding Zn-ribbon protein involved in translation (DUF1610 family)
VAKPELGLKRICLGCGVRFYDLNKTLVSCPSCGKEFDPLASSRVSRSRKPEILKNKIQKGQEKGSQKSGNRSSTEMDLDDEDGDVFEEDMDEDDELIGSIDKNSDKDGEET